MQKRTVRYLASILGLLLLFTASCYKRQTTELNPYCLSNSDCGPGMRCVAQFCQRSVDAEAEGRANRDR